MHHLSTRQRFVSMDVTFHEIIPFFSVPKSTRELSTIDNSSSISLPVPSYIFYSGAGDEGEKGLKVYSMKKKVITTEDPLANYQDVSLNPSSDSENLPPTRSTIDSNLPIAL